VAHKDIREIRVDLEVNRAAIAFPGGHPILLCATKMTRLLQTLAGIP
jgi:hypothetical protein